MNLPSTTRRRPVKILTSPQQFWSRSSLNPAPPAPQLKANHVGHGTGAAGDAAVLACRSFHRCHVCHLSLRFGKSANSEAKTEFRLHSYERTAILREVARGVPATARTGMDVLPNRGGTEHFREDCHGVARGARPAPATKGGDFINRSGRAARSTDTHSEGKPART